MWKYTQQRSCVFISMDVTPKAVIVLLFTCLLGVVGSLVASLSLIFAIFYKLKQVNHAFSTQTYSMQRQLFKSLVVQVSALLERLCESGDLFQFSLPAVFIGIPLSLLIIMVLLKQTDNELFAYVAYFLMHFLVVHSVFNTVAMVSLAFLSRRK